MLIKHDSYALQVLASQELKSLIYPYNIKRTLVLKFFYYKGERMPLIILKGNIKRTLVLDFFYYKGERMSAFIIKFIIKKGNVN